MPLQLAPGAAVDVIRTDVLIVGGGPAGAACAWALRRYGVDCLILERELFPRVKLCAGWVVPEIFADLELSPESYPHPLTRLTSLALSVRGFRLRLRASQLAVRRVEFDDWLLKRAGAPVAVHQVRQVVRRDGGYVVDGDYFARVLVGAGGTQCPVARTFFADANPRARDSLIVTQEEEFAYPHAMEGPANACHLWFFEDGLPGYAWYVPKAGGFVNVGVGGKQVTLEARGDTIKRHWDALVAKLDRLGLVRGYAYRPKGHAYYLRGAVSQGRVGNAYVVGDAAGLATLDMGEGIAPAIRSGVLAAEAIAHGGDYDWSSIRCWSQPRLIGKLLARAYG